LATAVVLKQYPDGTTINDKVKFQARVKELCDDVFIPILTEYHQSVDESVLKAKLQADNVYGGKTTKTYPDKSVIKKEKEMMSSVANASTRHKLEEI